ncbi:hypothetical protein GCM10010922_15560 [Microbacterium sorbitolivorans]|nr:hypothetical protein GCM10010922_15560 [Microbacterium sorbitolivorans]
MSSEHAPTVVPSGINDPVQLARAELKAALAAIEIKANYPKRISEASSRIAAKARTIAEKKPVVALTGARSPRRSPSWRSQASSSDPPRSVRRCGESRGASPARSAAARSERAGRGAVFIGAVPARAAFRRRLGRQKMPGVAYATRHFLATQPA